MYKIPTYFFFVLFCLAVTSFAAPLALSSDEKVARGNVSLQQFVIDRQVDSTYVLGPGDFLDLFLEENYFSVQVNPDGSIAINECGVVDVGGKTFAEAKEAILEKTSKRYDRRFTSVQLSRLKSFKLTVMGALKQVGQMAIEPQTTLSTVIRSIGGFLPTADKENVLIIRAGDSIKVNYEEMVRTGDFSKDIEMQQGDRLFVPYVDMSQAVTLLVPGGASISLPYREDRTVYDYYVLGVNDNIENGNFKSVKIKQPDGTEKRISIPETRTFKPQLGAEIQCIDATGTNEFVYVGGAVAVMGKVPYNPEFKALDYIAASGVTPITGSWDQVRVVRGNRESLDVNATGDVILPGDYIEIPKSTYETFKDFTMFLASLLTVLSSSFIIYMNYK